MVDALSGDGAQLVLTPEAPRPPSKLLWAAEYPRAAWTVATWWRHRGRLAEVRPGDGRAVMLLPGLFNSDRSDFVMARFLRRLEYRVEGWGLGRNFGARTAGAEAERLVARVEVKVKSDSFQ